MTKRIEIEFKSSVEIMNTPMKKRRFIVDEMIYPGLHVLSGDPKIGKAIGRNLNQIATLANMDRLTAVNFQPLLDEHRKVTELIGRLLREVK